MPEEKNKPEPKTKPEVVEKVKELMERGFTAERIKKNLVALGYSEQKAEKTVKQGTPEPEEKKEKPEKTKDKKEELKEETKKDKETEE